MPPPNPSPSAFSSAFSSTSSLPSHIHDPISGLATPPSLARAATALAHNHASLPHDPERGNVTTTTTTTTNNTHTHQLPTAPPLPPSTTSCPALQVLSASLPPQCRYRVRVEERGWRRVIQNFPPSWYSLTMGTGMVSSLLHALPYNQPAIQALATAVFVLNIVLFLLISLASVLRYALYPTLWTLLIRHPVQSLFWSCLPMGLATIINMWVAVCVEGWGWGGWAEKVAFGLWWVDVGLSVACCFVLPFLMIHVHPWTLESMTAAWLLPVAAPIVTASAGATVAAILSSKQQALMTVLVSYTLWGFGLPMAMLTLVIYFHRLAVHKLPPREVIVSVFLPLGPLGQGGFSLMNLGKVAMKLLPETGTLHPLAGDVLYVLGFIVAMVLWAFGLLWLFFAVASVSRSRFPFNVGCWGVLFPTGVYALSTMQIGTELPSAFFRIFGMIIACALVLLWVLISITTIRRAIKGDIFYSPALHDLQKLCPHAQTVEKAEKA